MKLDESYHEQDGCISCIFCYDETDWDCPTAYYCTKDNPMPKPHHKRKLRKWAQDRGVEAYGRCKFWEEAT